MKMNNLYMTNLTQFKIHIIFLNIPNLRTSKMIEVFTITRAKNFFWLNCSSGVTYIERTVCVNVITAFVTSPDS